MSWYASLKRLALISATAAVGVLLVAAPAGAKAPPEPAGGLELSIRADDPLAPVVVLTNRGDTPCRVATTSLGTLAFTRAEQGGRAIEPAGLSIGLPDDVGFLVAGSLRTLEKGAAQELKVPSLPGGPTGHGLRTVGWSPATGPYALLYPVRKDAPLALDVTYALPVVPDGGPPACATATGSTGSAKAAGPGGRGRTVASAVKRWGWPAAGGVVVAAVAVLVVLALLRHGRRRRQERRRSVAGTAGVAVLLAGLGVVGAIAGRTQPAAAVIRVSPPDPVVQKAWDDCSKVLHQPGHDPAGILPKLEGAGFDVELRRVTTQEDVGEDPKPGGAIIFWWPEDRHKYQGSGGNADPCTVLYHELYHAFQDAGGGVEDVNCLSATRPTPTNHARGYITLRELQATRWENELRAKLGLPRRDYYGYDQIPPDYRCLPVPADGRGTCKHPGGCAESYADPHLVTFDGRFYDFQAVGEFVAARDPAGGFEVQARQRPALGSRLVALNTAVAADVAGDRVEVRLAPDAPTGLALLVNGAERAAGGPLPRGGSLDVSDRVVVAWPDGSTATVVPFGRWGLNLGLEPARARAGRLEGLFGNFNGVPDDDVRPRGGAPIANPAFDSLYPAYADSWRVDAKTSLFTYPAGTTTDTYTDRGFPESPVRAADLPGHAAAEAFCRRNGLHDPQLVEACTLDLAVTGQPAFAAAAVAGQTFLGGFGGGGTVLGLNVTAPGAVATATFAGKAGEKVFVDIVATGLPDQCGALVLKAPDGGALAGACVVGGTGYVDGTVLPDTGDYSLVFDPAGTATGSLRLHVIRDVDTTGSIMLDGEAQAEIARPGEAARFSFQATAGQKVYVQVVRGGLPDECGVLTLRSPRDVPLAGGCVIGGTGFIDGTVLTEAGTYTVVVDPGARNTGRIKLRLVAVKDQQVPIEPGGPAVGATLSQPGAVARLTFPGTAGQRVSVEVLATTLPDECGVLSLVAPQGNRIAFGCVAEGKGKIAETALPTTGTYAILVDPGSDHLGEVRVQLKG